jgi:hypothetical protein
MFRPVVARRRPLLRAAAVGGTYAAGREMGRRAREREYDEESEDAGINAAAQSQAEPGQPQAPAAPVYDQLAQLVALHDKGALSDDEFAAAKAQVLGA